MSNLTNGGLKPLMYCLLVTAMAAVLTFFLFFSLDSSGDVFHRFRANIQQNAGNPELAKILKKAATDDRTVILTALNEAWASPGSIFDLLLESFHVGEGTQELLDHLVVVAMDPKAMNRCMAVHKRCFFLTTPGIDFSTEKRFMSHDYLKDYAEAA